MLEADCPRVLESKRTERYGRRAMDRPRVLLVPTLTEVEWKIRPLIEEWAEVASFDAPGVTITTSGTPATLAGIAVISTLDG